MVFGQNKKQKTKQNKTKHKCSSNLVKRQKNETSVLNRKMLELRI